MRALLPALLLSLGIALAQAAPPEPAGYWQGPAGGDVPASIAGGHVIHTAELAALLRRPGTVLVDVAAALRRPANLAAGALWLPLAHRDIPGSLWLPEAGQPAIPAAEEKTLRQRLTAASGHTLAAPVVVYCHPRCWLSWNAAKRIVGYGYTDVLWYPDGLEAWVAAGYPVAAARPEN